MQYALLIYGEERDEALTPEQMEEHARAASDFIKEVADRGVLHAGAPLRPTATATTVRAGDGKLLTTDGPFAETKEQLGGFFLIDVADLDVAIALAGRLAGTIAGAVEIRPVSTAMEDAVQTFS